MKRVEETYEADHLTQDRVPSQRVQGRNLVCRTACSIKIFDEEKKKKKKKKKGIRMLMGGGTENGDSRMEVFWSTIKIVIQYDQELRYISDDQW